MVDPDWYLVETSQTEAVALLEAAMKKLPTLTAHGLGISRLLSNVPKKPTPGYWQAKLEEGRAALRKEMHQVAAAADWLKRQVILKRVVRGRTSYGYKHDVENWFKARGRHVYVSNGAFIAAAVGLGISFAPAETLNVYFPFSKRTRSPGVV